MIEARGLTKSYGTKAVVDDLSFTVEPGVVTGFLGPNGAGKSTTMRMIVGLDAPSAGRVTVGGRAYASYRAPLREVGALLDPGALHAGRTARDHLRALAATNGIGRGRVEEVLELVGLGDVAGRRAGEFSLGMRQRLGIATALLGDPGVLILDEPVNGLDPEGVLWIRTLLTDLAAQGRTVLLSSHLMSEMALTAENLIVIGQGRLIREVSVADFIGEASASVLVRGADPDGLRALVDGHDATFAERSPGRLEISGMSSEEIGYRASEAGIVLFELTPVRPSLEAAYMALTQDHVEYRSPAPPPRDPRSHTLLAEARA